jgi:hypothetical protein
MSFVVHRAGDRWVCASAQNTDVIPAPAAATVLNEPGAFGMPGYPANPVA